VAAVRRLSAALFPVVVLVVACLVSCPCACSPVVVAAVSIVAL